MEIAIPKYNVNMGLGLCWSEGYSIKFSTNDNEVILSANRDGLVSLANHFPDSIAYVRCYTADTLNMEGWATYRANSRPHYVREFGEWKYYDGEGNCYRKFWNYKQNGKLIYEADR